MILPPIFAQLSSLRAASQYFATEYTACGVMRKGADQSMIAQNSQAKRSRILDSEHPTAIAPAPVSGAPGDARCPTAAINACRIFGGYQIYPIEERLPRSTLVVDKGVHVARHKA
jgi:hypothetical protein